MRRIDSGFVKYIFDETIVENSDIVTLPSDSNTEKKSKNGLPFVTS